MSSRKIGRYEIKEEIGRGGMAQVYVAYDPTLRRDVALKVLPTIMQHDPSFYDRFELEATTITSLEHSSIVPVYDFGLDGDWPFLVMRLMRGGTLSDRIDGGPMALADIGRIIRRLANALDRIHAADIVHRDLKPANVLFDDDNEAFLSDFGIVKLTTDSTSLTQTGSTIGTPAYMSPEQAKGEPVDKFTDIYSLGIMLYEMLTGEKPFYSETTFGYINAHVNTPPPAATMSRSDLPPQFDQIIEKALAKDPADRYQSAGELASDTLNAVQAGSVPAVIAATATAVPSRPPVTESVSQQATTSQPAAPPTQKKSGGRTWLWILLLFLLAGGIGGGLYLSGVFDAPQTVQETVAVVPEATDTPEPEPEPTDTSEPEPTNTPEPEPTDAPELEPTDAPELEPTEELAIVAAATNTPRPTSVPTPQPTATSTPIPVDPQVIVTAGSTDVRVGPGTNRTGLGIQSEGQILDLIGRNEDADWFKIIMSSTGQEAWVAAEDVKLVEGVDLDAVPVLDESAIIIGATSTPVVGGSTASAEATEEADACPAFDIKADVSSGNEMRVFWSGLPDEAATLLLVVTDTDGGRVISDTIDASDTDTGLNGYSVEYAKFQESGWNLFDDDVDTFSLYIRVDGKAGAICDASQTFSK